MTRMRPTETDAKATFNTLDAPRRLSTPGDNDWTDCDRNPGVNSAERLDFERKVLFSTPFTLGRHKLRQEVQDAPYADVDRRLERLGGVTYATLNVQGSSQQPLRHRARPRPSTRPATPRTSPGCTRPSPKRAAAARRP